MKLLLGTIAAMLYMSRKPVVVSVDSDWTAIMTVLVLTQLPRSRAGTPIDVMKLQTILYWSKAPPVGQKLGRCLRHKTF